MAGKGDILEARLMDSSFNTYFKERVDITNKKQIKKLIGVLRSKGVSFPIN